MIFFHRINMFAARRMIKAASTLYQLNHCDRKMILLTEHFLLRVV